MQLKIKGIVLSAVFNQQYGNSDITLHDLETQSQVRVSWKDGEFPTDPVQWIIPREYTLDGVKVFNGTTAKGKAYTQISCTALHAVDYTLQAPPAPRPNGKPQPEKA